MFGAPAQEPPHDVLAAEEFPVGAADPVLRRRARIELPPDGSDEPHDVLAAEEFAIPAPPPRPPGAVALRAPERSSWGARAASAARRSLQFPRPPSRRGALAGQPMQRLVLAGGAALLVLVLRRFRRGA
jgi:hypothetical protein